MAGRAGSVALALALVALLTFNIRHHLLDIRHAKGQTIANETFQKWNSFSRIGLTHSPNPAEEHPDLIVIDADASTGIANFDFEHLTPHQRHDLLEQGPALPYAVRPGAKTLIIGPGGGWDVARALASGSHDITGVEINPIIAETIMQERMPELSKACTRGRTCTSTWKTAAASCAAAPTSTRCCRPPWWTPGPPPRPAHSRFPKTTSTPPTPSATTCSHLTDDGMIAFTRWGFEPPRESLRLVSLAMEALGQIGESRPWTSTSSWAGEARCRAGARRIRC